MVGLVTNAGLSKLYRRRSIRRQLYESVDRVVRIAHGRNGVLITRSDSDASEWYRPVPPDQRTLDDFEDARPRIVDLAAVGEPRPIRAAEHMRFSW